MSTCSSEYFFFFNESFDWMTPGAESAALKQVLDFVINQNTTRKKLRLKIKNLNFLQHVIHFFPVLWIRNYLLFRIRIQLWIFPVPDPDQTYTVLIKYSVAELPLFWAALALAPGGQGPGANSGSASDLLGSAPAPG